MKISLIIPTRKRISNVKRLVESVYNTAQDINNIQLMFYVDDDDQDSIDFFDKEKANPKFTHLIDTKIVVEPRQERFGETNNILYRASDGDILMLGADDIAFRTKNWDHIVREEFGKHPDRLALVFGYDGIQPPGTLATHCFISRRGADAVGYASPGDFGYNYADNWMTELYRQIDRLRYVPMHIEHMHWGVGKAEYDETYRLGSDAPHDESKAIWEDKDRLTADIKKLQDKVGTVD